MKMTSESEAMRVTAIRDKLSILYGLELNPMLSEILDELVVDVDWLSERLMLSWSTIASYQEEIRVLLGGR